METGIHNTSEIGRLKKVMLHRPGEELENLMPEYLERLLFDDIPYLKEAQREHDAFADCLRQQGVEVVYLTDLVVNSLTSGEVRQDFIRQYLDESGVRDDRTRGLLADYLPGRGFRHTAAETEADPMATEQGLYALAAVCRARAGKPFLYDMTDVKPEPVSAETAASRAAAWGARTGLAACFWAAARI